MNKVALVTGSSKGIGKGIVKKLLKKGYIVYANGRDKTTLDKKFKNSIIIDMSKKKNIKNAINSIIRKEGRLDLVVANLGSGKSILGTEIDIKEYKRVFNINFFSSVMLATYAIPHLKKSNGNIIFISSIAGNESIGAPIAYESAKTALLSYSKNLSKQLGSYNIRVNCISPGNVMFKNSTWDKKRKQNKENVDKYIENNVPLNRFAKPKDIAKAVYFLEKNDFITGSNIVIDGGQTNKII